MYKNTKPNDICVMRTREIIAVIMLIVTPLNIPVLAQETNEKNVRPKVNKTEIVVNKRLIEMYKNMDVGETSLTLNEIISNYSFEEVKSVLHAYSTNQLCEVKKESIDSYLAEQKANSKTVYKRKPEGPLLTDDLTDSN